MLIVDLSEEEKMMIRNVLGFILLAGILSACQSGFAPVSGAANNTQASSSNPPSPASIVVDQSKAHKMLLDLSSQLSVKANAGLFALTPTQIANLISQIEAELAAAHLSSSNDLNLILPILMAGASSAIGGLNLSSVTDISSLLSSIANSYLASALKLSSGQISLAQIESLAASLFANLSKSGVAQSDLSSLANSVMSLLLGDIASTGLASIGPALESIVQSIASGAITGLGKSGISSDLLNSILNDLGAGGFSGISNLINSLSGKGLASTLESLLKAFAAGSNSGLSNIIGILASGGSSSQILNQLLMSLLGGMSGAANNSGSPQNAISLIASFIEMLIVNGVLKI